MPTSLSDEPTYIDYCERAASDPAAFATFRQAPLYRRIVETVRWKRGAINLKRALQLQPRYFKLLREFARNDDYGGAIKSNYFPVGRFATTTLRYIRIAAEIESLFGRLDGWRIAEIGGGYGGQCRILASLFKFKSYAVYDLPAAQKLTARYLSCFPVENVTFPSIAPIAAGDFDLVISNYAFSELTKPVQDEYLSAVIDRSAHGYILHNQLAEEEGLASNSIAALRERLRAKRPTIAIDPPKRHGVYLVRW